MLSKYGPVHSFESGLADIRIHTLCVIEFLLEEAPCFLLCVLLEPPLAWMQLCGWPRRRPEGENGSTHLESHQGPIRKLTPIWFGDGGVFFFVCFFMLTMKVTLIYNSVGWSREERLLWVEKIN